MSFAWHEIRDHLMHSASTLSFQRSFDAIRRDHGQVLDFRDPVGLLDALHHGDDTADRKNDVLVKLISAAQADSRTASCAQTLVLLALWPGLDAVRKRLVWRWKLPPEETTAEVMTFACKAIADMDLTRVNRVAATLLRNIERDIGRDLRRDADRSKQHTEIDPDQLPRNAGSEDPREGEAYLARDVEALIGRDAELVLSVALGGLTHSEAGAALGLTEAAARKRFQRATHRLRDALH
jgi:hypothetical protein